MINHIVYISDDLIQLFEWKGKRLIAHLDFANTEDELQIFKEVVASLSDHPVKILIDLQEEDYQRETIPYSSKKNQAFMADRLLGKYYRDAQYRYFEVQGRNQDGRRDSRVLLASVSIDDKLRQFIDALSDADLEIAGIWSVPLLSNNILKNTDFSNDNFILISKENNHYRESVFVNKEMVISRKIPIEKGANIEQEVQVISTSIDHLHKFSTNKRYIGFQDDLYVVCLVDEGVFEQLQNKKNNKFVRYQYFSIENLFEKIEPVPETVINMDIIYSYLCANRATPHYSNQDEKQALVKKRANKISRIALSVASLFLVFMAAAIAINNNSVFELAKKINAEADSFTADYQSQFNLIQHKLDNIEIMTEFFDESLMRKQEAKSMPVDLFFDLSSILDSYRYQTITLQKIKWKRYQGAERDAISDVFPKASDAGSDEYIDYDDGVESQEQSAVYAHISGVFDHRHLDYSDAVNTMVFFNNALKSIAVVDDVYMVSAPVDVRSHSQFIDFSGSLLSLNISKSNRFEFILYIRDKSEGAE